MNWMHDAVSIYDDVMSGRLRETTDCPLVPICHTEANAHIEITLDGSGKFMDAKMVPKKQALTIMPCTEASGNRTSGIAPHPLHDKLQYLASDYQIFCKNLTKSAKKRRSKYAQFIIEKANIEKQINAVETNRTEKQTKALLKKKDKILAEIAKYEAEEPFPFYKKQLQEWCFSCYSNPKAKAVLSYIECNSLMKDLSEKISTELFEKKKLRQSFLTPKDYASGSPVDCFVRWRVEIPGDPESRLWCDKTVQQSWVDFYLSTKQEKGRCYVTGELVSLGTLHPSRLRHGGDQAKLISANDDDGFTFRGRVTTDREACGVGFEFSQKAHNALRWLIARQGRHFGDCSYVVWGWNDDEFATALDPFSDTDQAFASLFGDAESESSQLDRVEELAEGRYVTLETLYAQNLMQCMAGYRNKLSDNHRNIRLVAIDSATTGRMSLVLDRAIESSRLLQNLQDWHCNAAWLQNFGLIGSGKQRKSRRFIGAPAPSDIAKAAYGQDSNNKLISATINRILATIIDGAIFPEDICRACISRIIRRSGCEDWEWEKALGIACSLYRFTNKERNYQMELEKDCESRDYLWGRLLALAEVTERYSLEKQSGEKRSTNAERLFMRFAEQPYSTWTNIELALRPYLDRLAAGDEKAQGIRKRYNRLADDLMVTFKMANLDFTDNSRLSGEFLLGYHCQRHALYTKTEKPAGYAKPEEEEQDNE